MEVEFSTSSGCFGASERRRETSTTEEFYLAYMEEKERACGHLDGEWMRLAATCESDPMFGMSFANVNIERIFLYFHYEFVKRDFG